MSSGEALGLQMHALAAELFPIPRSLTGAGVRDTLRILQRELPLLRIHEVPSGTRVLDWTIPPEWTIRDAYIVDPAGNRICDFRRNNLHVVGYSVPFHASMSLANLQPHLHSLEDQPDAIPYITSYYEERWGFCLPHRDRMKLIPGTYEVHIDSKLAPGSLTYGEILLAGESDDEIFLSTYICHPSMANNELSGPVVTAFLGRWLASLPRRRYSYRMVFIPETIGSITYLARNLPAMQKSVRAGFNVTCVGDERCYSYLPSRSGFTLTDRVAQHVLSWVDPNFRRFSYLDRGSDERQYCAPGVDLPVVSVMRSKYAEFPEYHTSKDDLTLVTPAGLLGGYTVLQRCIEAIEANVTTRSTVLGEPQLGKRGLYPSLSTKTSGREVSALMDLIAYSDGKTDLIDIAETIKVPVWTLYDLVARLAAEGLLQTRPA
jgi:aminopeptidase-like protein